jgi:hypothetical protein
MSPGGVDLSFYNDKTREESDYYPDGMTAKEILNVRGARRHFGTKEVVERFMAEMDVQRERHKREDMKASGEAE